MVGIKSIIVPAGRYLSSKLEVLPDILRKEVDDFRDLLNVGYLKFEEVLGSRQGGMRDMVKNDSMSFMVRMVGTNRNVSISYIIVRVSQVVSDTVEMDSVKMMSDGNNDGAIMRLLIDCFGISCKSVGVKGVVK